MQLMNDDQSVAQIKRALGIRKATLGDAHPDVAATLDKLAMLNKKSGRK